MALAIRSFGATRRPLVALIGAAGMVLLALGGWQAIRAQVEGDRGIAPVAASRDIQIGGIKVVASGKNAEDARQNGYQLAQRKAWEKLGGPAVPDSRIQSMVSAVVIESEQIGPRRYVASLGVIFDKQRAGALLGQGGARRRSAPMLLLPVVIEGGAATMFERRTEWQRVWAEYQAGASAIDYVRPSGSGGESLLLTYGQTQRRSRLWWRTILNSFGAADVIIPIARLERQYPGGPVKGYFTARYGPENRVLDQFTLSVERDSDLDEMLEVARTRFDAIFTRALRQGKLKPDPTLGQQHVGIPPEIAALIEAERSKRQVIDAAPTRSGGASTDNEPSAGAPTTDTPAEPAVNSYAVTFNTPDAASLESSLSGVRGVPGVRAVAVSSTAIGGTSTMRVTFAGDLTALADALRGRGWRVNQGPGGLGITR
ncbi:heavy-metal-associated domain-containing protein [Altererythrobacter sp. CAU 1778]